jgi:hypothetical protein
MQVRLPVASVPPVHAHWQRGARLVADTVTLVMRFFFLANFIQRRPYA